ncbi:MAG: 30S ribosomal protein S17 [bacterium]
MDKKTITGKVKSVKMQKTAVVVVNTVKPHPLYGKRIKRAKSFKAHIPEKIEVKENDFVKIESCRPLSKDKRWQIVKVL